MKKWLLLLLILCGASLCVAQGVRYDLPPVISPRGLPIPNIQVSLCPGTAVISGSTCGTTAQAFTDQSLNTPCTSGLPVTPPNLQAPQGVGVCSATGDSLGNVGFWLSPGSYIYCLSGPSITGKCYNLTVPVGGTSGGIMTFGSSKALGYDISQNGMVGDGATDNTAAFNTLVTTACTSGIHNLLVPVGNFVFKSAPAPIPCGLWLIGFNQSLGVIYGNGSFFTVTYNEGTPTNGFLLWNGANNSTQGNGGGIIGLNILVNAANTAGVLVKVTAPNCTNRAGGMTFADGKYGGAGGGNESYAFYFDGSGCTTSGTQGVRDNYIEYGVLTFNSTVEAVHMDNCVHCHLNGLLTSPGTGNGNIKITGQGTGTAASTDVELAGASITGNIALDFAANVVIGGTQVTGTISSTANTVGSFSAAMNGSYSLGGGLAVIGYDSVGAASQAISFVNALRAANGIASGAAVPPNFPLAGAVAGNFFQRTDNLAIFKWNNGSGSLTNRAYVCCDGSTILENFDSVNGYSTTLPISGGSFKTATNCAVNSVSPAACGSAAAGAFVVPTTTTTYTVNTTVVTAASRIFIEPMSFAGNLPSAPTCVVPTTPFISTVSAISAGTSFTLTLPSTTGQTCWQYWIVN